MPLEEKDKIKSAIYEIYSRYNIGRFDEYYDPGEEMDELTGEIEEEKSG